MRPLRISLAFLAAASAAVAADGSGNLEMSRIPTSVRQQGAGSSLGGYDAFTPFSNPALLANQGRRWEAAFSGQSLFGMEESFVGLAGSWAGADPDKGAFAGAVMFAGGGPESFPYMDLQGNKGADISYNMLRAGAVGAWQKGIFCVGAGAEVASESFNEANIFDDGPRHAYSGIVIHGGALVKVTALDLGVSYHRIIESVTPVSTLDAGAAWRFRGKFKGSAFFETSAVIAGDSTIAQIRGNTNAFGLEWNAHRLLDVRLGMRLGKNALQESAPPEGRAGFSVHWGPWALDYALGVADNGLGMSHSVGINRGFGPDRPEPTPLDFGRLFAKKDASPAFQATGGVKSSLAVANFEPQNVSAGDAAVIADLLRSALVQDNAFNIVEKANMDKILQEQAFQQTGCTSQECAVKIGKVLNVKYLVVGSFGKTLDQYLMAMRVVEVETARIVYSDEAQGKNLEELRNSIKIMAHRLSVAVTK